MSGKLAQGFIGRQNQYSQKPQSAFASHQDSEELARLESAGVHRHTFLTGWHSANRRVGKIATVKCR